MSPFLSRNDAVEKGARDRPGRRRRRRADGSRRAGAAPNGIGSGPRDVFGQRPKTAGATPALPKATASFRLRHLFKRDPEQDRKLKVFSRTHEFGDGVLLVSATAAMILGLAGFNGFAWHRPESAARYALTTAVFFGPAIWVVCLEDIFRRRLNWKRGLAFLLSTITFALVILAFHEV